MKISSVKDIENLSGAAVLLRSDFNVPLEKKKILDDFRMRAALVDIKYLIARQAKIVLATHLGDPKGRPGSLSTKLLLKDLNSILGAKVKFIPAVCGSKVNAAIDKMKPGQVILLENLRFEKGEKKNDKDFAKKLAAPFDYYVNNAFAVSHRDQASVSAIKAFLPSFAGILLEQELEAMERVLSPKDPLVVVMGGKKISTKAPIIKKLYSSASKIMLGGALANSFLKASGLEVGKSLIDKDGLSLAKKILKLAKASNKIILPVDVITVEGLDKKMRLTKKTIIRIKPISNITKNEVIVDIGPDTIQLFSKEIKTAQTLVWNGPMGLFEVPAFKQGTIILARMLAIRSFGRAYGVAGGGETVEAINCSKMGHYFDWVSTGGGAMLSYLSGDKMPGLTGLVKK